VEPEVRGFADDLFRIANRSREEIDKRIEAHAEHCRVDGWPRWTGTFCARAWRSS